MKRLRLVCDELGVDISVEMGDGPARPVQGLAAWEVIERVEGKGITDRSAVPPFAQEVPILLDGWADDRSVQPQLREIEKLGGLGAGIFRAFGPIHRPGIRYVLGAEPSFDGEIRDEDGDRLLRQRMVLTLLEHSPADRLRTRGRIGIGPAIAVGGTYTTKQGDTLSSIAAKLYRDASQWRKLGNKNDIHDPFRVLPAGRVLRV